MLTCTSTDIHRVLFVVGFFEWSALRLSLSGCLRVPAPVGYFAEAQLRGKLQLQLSRCRNIMNLPDLGGVSSPVGFCSILVSLRGGVRIEVLTCAMNGVVGLEMRHSFQRVRDAALAVSPQHKLCRMPDSANCKK